MYIPRACLTHVLIVKDHVLVGLNPKRGSFKSGRYMEAVHAQSQVIFPVGLPDEGTCLLATSKWLSGGVSGCGRFHRFHLVGVFFFFFFSPV